MDNDTNQNIYNLINKNILHLIPFLIKNEIINLSKK